MKATLNRIAALIRKETLQILRDKPTLMLLIGVPILQLILFGYAINMVPKNLATVVTISDPGPLANSVVAALSNSGYFRIITETQDPKTARTLLARGEVSFAVEIPPNFTRDLVRGRSPALRVESDATDPSAGAYAMAALSGILDSALENDLTGPLAAYAPENAPYSVSIHQLYNPESITRYNIVPGMLGVMLTLTMVLVTAISLTRERERGTYENLLAMPVRPTEIMIGKITPNILAGAVQCALILLVARFLFQIPMLGPLTLLGGASAIYIAALLAIGFAFSTFAANQLQGVLMTFVFLLFSIMLSGFIFPFRGMPDWAQAIGEALPITHFLRITRGILLKGNGMADIWGEIWPMVLFCFVVGSVAIRRFHRTLD